MVCRKWRDETQNEGKWREEKNERERRGKRMKTRGVKRSWSGYETNSDLIWCVYDSVLRCRLELDWALGLG